MSDIFQDTFLYCFGRQVSLYGFHSNLHILVGFCWDGIQDSCRLQALSMNITKWQVEMHEGLAEGTDSQPQTTPRSLTPLNNGG